MLFVFVRKVVYGWAHRNQKGSTKKTKVPPGPPLQSENINKKFPRRKKESLRITPEVACRQAPARASVPPWIPALRPTGKSDGGGVGDPGRGQCKNRGPHLTSARLRQRLGRCTAYRSRPGPPAGPPSHCPPSTASSPSVPACGRRLAGKRPE